jgi:phosphatidylglycerophosphate synthase
MLDWLNRRMPGLRHAILRPFVCDVNPNTITFIALLVAVLAGLAFYRQLLLPAALLVLVSGFLDMLDGEIASKYGKSKRGDLLDHTADRLADVAILAGIIAGGFVDILLGPAAIIAVLLVSYIGTEAQALTKKRLYAGLLGRSDRLVLVAAGAVVFLYWPWALETVFAIIFVLSAVTFFQRFVLLWKVLR